MMFLMHCFYLGQGNFLLFVCLSILFSFFFSFFSLFFSFFFLKELWTRSVTDVDVVVVVGVLLLLLFLAGSENPDIAIHYTRKGEQPDFLPPLKEMLNDLIYSTPPAIAYISATQHPHPLATPTPNPHPTPKHPPTS